MSLGLLHNVGGRHKQFKTGGEYRPAPFRNTISMSKPIFSISNSAVYADLSKNKNKKTNKKKFHSASFIAMRKTRGHGCS